MKHKKSIIIIISIMLFVVIITIISLFMHWKFCTGNFKDYETQEVTYNYDVSAIERIEMNSSIDKRSFITVGKECYEDVVQYLSACTFKSAGEWKVKEDDWKYRFIITADGQNTLFVFYEDCCVINSKRYIFKSTSATDIREVWYSGVNSMDDIENIMSYLSLFRQSTTSQEMYRIMGAPHKTMGSGIVESYYYMGDYEVQITRGTGGIKITNKVTGEKIDVPKKLKFFCNTNYACIQEITIDYCAKSGKKVVDSKYYECMMEYYDRYTFYADYFGEVKEEDWLYTYTALSDGESVEIKFYDTYCLINGERYRYTIDV